MAEKVKLSLSAHHKGRKPGDTLEVESWEAKRLIAAGVAVPATVAAAKAVGVDAEEAASKRA